MSEEIVWGDPPEAVRRRGPHKWKDILTPLMERPGEWARVRTYKKPGVANCAVLYLRGRIRDHQPLLPSGEWEFCSREVAPDSYGIWARYLGPSKDAK